MYDSPRLHHRMEADGALVPKRPGGAGPDYLPGLGGDFFSSGTEGTPCLPGRDGSLRAGRPLISSSGICRASPSISILSISPSENATHPSVNSAPPLSGSPAMWRAGSPGRRSSQEAQRDRPLERLFGSACGCNDQDRAEPGHARLTLVIAAALIKTRYVQYDFQVIFQGWGENVERLRVPERRFRVTPAAGGQLNERQKRIIQQVLVAGSVTRRCRNLRFSEGVILTCSLRNCPLARS
jgi:hypothetical protein